MKIEAARQLAYFSAPIRYWSGERGVQIADAAAIDATRAVQVLKALSGTPDRELRGAVIYALLSFTPLETLPVAVEYIGQKPPQTQAIQRSQYTWSEWWIVMALSGITDHRAYFDPLKSNCLIIRT